MKKTTVVIIVVLALAAGAAAGLAASRWYGPGAQTAGVAREKGGEPAKRANGTNGASGAPQSRVAATRVALARVEKIPFARGVSAVGSLRSDESVVLRPEVAGRVQRLNFVEGAMVPEGQILVQLDDSVPRAELAQAQANLSLAQSQYRRSGALQKEGFVSQQARDESASALQAQQANAALARARLEKMTIRAPFAGMVGLRAVSVGDYVNQGQDLAPLVAVDPLKVDFRVPEMYFTRLKVGQTLTLRLDALQGAERTGQVFAVSPVVDAGGRSVLLRATVANSDGMLRPGMFARVQLIFNQENALVVPETALSPSGETQYVFRVRENIAHRVQVTLGERRDGRVEILEGLSDGDQVVVSGLQRVIDGGAVEPLAPGA